MVHNSKLCDCPKYNPAPKTPSDPMEEVSLFGGGENQDPSLLDKVMNREEWQKPLDSLPPTPK